MTCDCDSRKLGFVLGVLCFLSFSACKNDLDAAKQITSKANVNIERGKDVEIIYSSAGENKIKAYAKTVLRFNTEKPYMEFIDGIKINFFGKYGSVETVMTAKHAMAQDGSSLMTARNNVVVTNVRGERLDTEELIWDESRKQIYSNAFVKITTNDEILLGNGMESNETFTDYTIKHITGTLKVNSEEIP
jgi:LPS export ABC transporter protein LptC